MTNYGLINKDKSVGDDDENIQLLLENNSAKRFRNFQRTSSVILPNTGERVQGRVSFSNTSDNSNFESFNNNIGLDNHSSPYSTFQNPDINGNTDSNPRSPVNEILSLLHGDFTPLNKFKILAHYLYHYLIDIYYNEIFRNVVKCSLTYLIASLAVYWKPFHKFLGGSDFKHVVCTVVVYFHPSRSKGSMHITLLYVIISLTYSFVISFGCRYISTFFFKRGQAEISYAVDLIISSTALGVVAFMKQKINKETFNTACSLASISIVASVIKEGSMNSAVIPLDRLKSTLLIVVSGCAISVIICYTVWPQTAEIALKKDLNESYNIMSSLLSLVANKFLTGEKLTPQDNELFNKAQKNIASLTKNLEQTKYELFVKGQEKRWDKLNELVNTTISLSTHLHALRSSVEMQWKLLHESQGQNEPNSTFNHDSSVSSLKSLESNAINISYSVENLDKINTSSNNTNEVNNELDYVAINSAQIFDLFVYYLSPSMKAFIFTIKNILSEVPFKEHKVNTKIHQFIKTSKFQKSLSIAIDLFNEKQINSFDKLYNQEIFKINPNSDFLFKSDLEEVTACCGNFSSLLKLFGKELLQFLVLMENYEKNSFQEASWNWLRFWESKPEKSHKINDTSNIHDALLTLQSQYNVHEDNFNTNRVDYYGHRLWHHLKVFRRTDVQFGIRVGLGAFVLSLFAFYPKTKFLFNNWRGEWSLTIYCIMMNKSLGGTSMTVKWRFIGTFLGAILALIVWKLFDGDPIALALSGFLFSMPCFYILIYWKRNNAFGRFILLTYNLTALYSYTMELHDSEDGKEGGDSPLISEIAFHRFISVSVGIIWALTMASVFIPNSARSRLKLGLTILWLRIGVIWYSDPLDYTYDEPTGNHKLISLKGETGLNGLLSELEVLLRQAPLEFRLKGKFPKSHYEKLLNYTSNIIDALHNMILMIEVDPILLSNEEYVIKYIESERHELEHRIFLIFYMIASAMKLGFPLPNKPASTEHAKDRLLYKLSEIRSNSVNNDQVSLSNEDYVLLYSYLLVTSTLTQELDKIIQVIIQLMGDISEEIFQLV